MLDIRLKMKRYLCRIIAFALAVFAAVQGALAAQLLEVGASGETVNVLTRRLCELGYIDASVSEYDDSVISAVGDFQTANGLERTGTADVATQQALYSENAVSRGEYINSYINKYAGISLTLKSTGELVTDLQSALRELGYYEYQSDGVFGEATQSAVESYQRANGLRPTGIADASTLIRLLDGQSIGYDDYIQSQCAQRGESGINVKLIQDRLRELGYFYGDATGTFGDNTEQAVKRFQSENAIYESGIVDVKTYATLFSEEAVGAPNDGSIYAGSQGDAVYSLQQRLLELGFFDITPNGVYARATETAVMLFCAANGFEISPDASAEVVYAIGADDAKGIEALEGSLSAVSDEVMHEIAQSALSLIGTEFPTEEGDLFPGFILVRYAFACNGIAVCDPGEIISQITQSSPAQQSGVEGDIIVLTTQRDGALRRCFAICVGSGNIVYVDEASGIVVENAISNMDYETAYIWDFASGE